MTALGKCGYKYGGKTDKIKKKKNTRKSINIYTSVLYRKVQLQYMVYIGFNVITSYK